MLNTFRLANRITGFSLIAVLTVVELQSQRTMPKFLLAAVTALQLLQVAAAKVEECVTCESNRIEPIVAVDDSSHCQFRQACDQSTPGTGHKYFTNLTEDLITVERCYSFCFKNVRPHTTLEYSYIHVSWSTLLLHISHSSLAPAVGAKLAPSPTSLQAMLVATTVTTTL